MKVVALKFIFVTLMGVGAVFTMFIALCVLVEIINDMLEEIKRRD